VVLKELWDETHVYVISRRDWGIWGILGTLSRFFRLVLRENGVTLALMDGTDVALLVGRSRRPIV
jgi:hypothetical protein